MKDAPGHQPEGELIYWSISGGSHRPRLALFFALVEGRAECVRVEIGPSFLEGENPRELGAKFDSPRLRALDTATLRGIRLHSEVKKARRQWLGQLEEIAQGSFLGTKVPASARLEAKSRLGIAQEAARHDRPLAHLGKEHFQRVALVYRVAHERGAPTQAVAARFNVSYSTAEKWVSRARHEYGLLPKTRRGKARSSRSLR
jgi:hypothetical protein